MTWESELEDYLAWHEAKGTSAGYRRVAATHLRRVGERYRPDSFLDLTREDVVRWVSELRGHGLKDTSLRTTVGRLRTFLRWLNDGQTPASLRGLSVGRDRPRIQTKDQLLSDGEWERILNAMKPRDRLVFSMLRATGGRPAEVLELKGEDVVLTAPHGHDGAELTFRDTKNGTTRCVPILGGVVRDLRAYLDVERPGPEDYLFPSSWSGRGGKPITPGSLWRILRRTADRVGIEKDVFPYMARHEKATKLYQAPPGVRDRLMGWEGPAQWKNYEHLDTDDAWDYLLATEGATEDVAERILAELKKIAGDPEKAERFLAFLEKLAAEEG